MAMDLGLANYFLIACFSWLVFYTVSIFVLVLCIHINALHVYIFSLGRHESPKSRPGVEPKDGTPKKQKQCKCRNSRCLKL